MESNTDFFKSISDFLWKMTDQQGRLLCLWHQTEHTGKNIYGAAIDLGLYELGAGDDYFFRAKKRVFYTLTKLSKDNGKWIFYPGRLGRRNLSNNVIDCGACIDVLAGFYGKYADRLSAREKGELLNAIQKVSETYLQKAVIDKEVTNQRLWGATGLAAAYKITGDEKWKEACLRSIEKSLKEQNPDGSFPYHPNWRAYNAHEGMSDFSPYYQSRHLAFLYYIIGEINPTLFADYRDAFLRGCDFLVGITHPDGIKEMGLESKRYYWNPYYEIASNSFDVFALAQAYFLTKNPVYGYYARQSFNQLPAHQREDGGITGSKFAEADFKCRIFINAQLIWALRALDKLPKDEIKAPEKEKVNFPDAGVYKYKNKNYCAIFRYKKKLANITRGAPAGGGSLIYYGKKNNWQNALGVAGDFVITPLRQNYPLNIKDFFRNNTLKDIYFRIVFCGTTEFLAGKYIYSFFYPFKTVIKPFFWSLRKKYAANWSLDANLTEANVQLVFNSSLATIAGENLPNSSVDRLYQFLDDGVGVREMMKITGVAGKCVYHLPLNFKSLEIKTNNFYRVEKNKIIFYSSSLINADISYRVL